MPIREKKTYRNVGATEVEVSQNSIVLSGILFHNDDAAVAFIQMFDALAANITVGTTVPDVVIRLAADSFLPVDCHDMKFSTALTFVVTTTAEGNTGGTANHITMIVL